MKLLVFSIAMIFFTSLIPISNAENILGGFNGVSWKPVVPIKKATFVGFDEDSYLDDYAYLAAVPSSVFYNGGKIFSNPLLYYQDSIHAANKTRLSLNARQGLDYFMEDWIEYCGELDKIELINVPLSKGKDWPAKNYTVIESENPYEIAAKIALHDWSYSNDAVIAIIEKDFEKPTNATSGTLEGSLHANKIKTENFTVKQTNKLNPIYHEFEVGKDYKYVKVISWWPSIQIARKLFQNISMLSWIKGGIIIPTGNPNLQLYCNYGDERMQVGAAELWNVIDGLQERIESYVYNLGKWWVSLTDVPTHGGLFPNPPPRKGFGLFEWTKLGEFLWDRINRQVTYHINVEMYPGEEIDIPDPPYGCRDVDFKLTWDNPDASLGFSIIGPCGEEIFSATNESRNYQEIHLDQLGECTDDGYSICVFSMNDLSSPVNFEVDYQWHQNISKCQGNSLTSATEGAVLASIMNAPLLYTSPSSLPDATKDALRKLGVKKACVVDIGSGISDMTLRDIRGMVDIERYTELRDIYDAIRDHTDRNDVIFSTLDPWSYWYVGEHKPAGEKEGALYLGPAAYLAAHHGSPVLLVDNHPRLSSAVVYHNEFWKRYARHPEVDLSVAEMFLTGRSVYDFLREYGFDEEGMETMITVAGQFDIGIPWDRTFVGKAKPGRICGTPVDTSYWISRNVFYPAVIFANPALNPNGVNLINGSSSKRMGGKLWITKPCEEENFKYPVLNTWITYQHRFNERGSKFWNFKYKCADDIVPGETESNNPIDQGTCKKYAGKEGCYWPDMTESEIAPFYCEKAGYSNVYATNFPSITEDLNKGVIMWLECTHGFKEFGDNKSGVLSMWDPNSPVVNEPNPWRGYEWMGGSTEEPDTLTADTIFNSGWDFIPAKKPLSELMNKLIPFIDPFETEDRYDGIVISVVLGRLATTPREGYDFDRELKNIHSCGFISGACLISNTYLHLTMIRHGSAFQIIDPWVTSWYSAVWGQSIPRDLALGDTIGEAYAKGIHHVGIEYLTGQWWWDVKENVCLFGDPDLRVWMPHSEYTDKNTWNEPASLVYAKGLSIDGHTPFGAVSYPHEIKPFPWLMIGGIILVIIAGGVAAFLVVRRKRSSS